MSSSENDIDNNDDFESSNINLDELAKITNFSKNQIMNFHKYFRKFKIKSQRNDSNIDLLKSEEFKNSLGVLSTRECDYISNRLFHVITGENSEYISFKDYILFLNLVNYGTKEEKLKHCFNFFDIGNKGYITNKDFTEILYNMSLFLSSLTISQILVNEKELSNLYDYYINKAKIQQLDFKNFKILIENFPSFLDFYDIFNNNIYYDMNFFIKKEQVDELIDIKEKLYEIKEAINMSEIKSSSISLVTEGYIDEVIEIKKEIENMSSISIDSKFNMNGKDNNNLYSNNLNSENNYNNLKFSDFLLFSGAESENDGKSNMNSNMKVLNNYSNNYYFNNTSNSKLFNKEKRNYYTPMKESQAFLNFNQMMKNSDNSKIEQKKDSSDDINLDLSDSSSENSDISDKKINENKNNKINHKNKKDKKESSIKKNSKNKNKKFLKYQTLKEERKNPKKSVASSNNKSYKTIRNSKSNLLEKIFEKRKKFQFFKPFTSIKDEKLISHLKKNGYDNLENILILTNKSKFKSFIDDIISALGSLINNILPEKLKSRKRQGLRLNDNFELDLNKITNAKNIQDDEIQKNIIHFGNPNLKTVINIMIGIKSAVSKIGTIPIKNLDLKISYLFPVDNMGVYEEMNRFMYEQNNYDGIIKCKFYDYAPKIFYNLRTLYGISNDDYLKSLGPENFLCNLIITKNKSLKEICSSGKSGSFFYYSYDSKYLMKTIPETEFLKFKEMLQDYYTYMYENPKTLLQRLFGLYMCLFDDVKMYFVVMNNVFNTPLKVHYKYDLKGSTYKRQSRKCKEINYDNYDFDIAMKDNDFTDRNEKIFLSPFIKRTLSIEIKKDSKFLSDHNINDYSFLIGVNDQKWYTKEQLSQEKFLLLTTNKTQSSSINSTVVRKPFYEEYYGGIQSDERDKVYFFGIIDIFTNYGGKKKMEYIVKSVSQGSGISCKPPDEYSKRFINFVNLILDMDNDNNNSNNEYKKKNKNNDK